jgi:hypothetical protein
MKLKQPARAKYPRRTCEHPKVGYSDSACVAHFVRKCPKFQTSRLQQHARLPPQVLFEIWNLRFEICAPKARSLSPRLHSRPEPEIDFDLRSQRRLWVWIDAIPQRNCGRFSRPSPIPEMSKEQRNVSRHPDRSPPPTQRHPSAALPRTPSPGLVRTER